jgi:hypothetical protein
MGAQPCQRVRNVEPGSHVLISRHMLGRRELRGVTVGQRNAHTGPRRPRLRPHVPAPAGPPFDDADLGRIRAALGEADRLAAADPGALLVKGGSASEGIRQSCTFAHCAILLFPDTVESAMRHFADQGLDPRPPVPSVLVRRRLCERYGLEHDACDVAVTRLRPSPNAPGHTVEVFLFPRSAEALTPAIIENERTFRFENHLALDIVGPDEQRLERLMALLQRDVGLVWEGGGHNRYEGSHGSTVFYFVGDRFERWELHCDGDLSPLIDRHPVETARVTEVYDSWTRSVLAAAGSESR